MKMRKIFLLCCSAILIVFVFSGFSRAKPGNDGIQEGEYLEGIINSVNGTSEIVINDQLFTVDNGNRCYGLSGQSVSSSFFLPGDVVLYHVSEDGVLKKIRLIERGGSVETQLPGNENTIHHDPSRKIFRENGVWKN